MCYTTFHQDCVCAHHPTLMVIHVERLIDRLFSLSLFLALFLSVCLSYTLLTTPRQSTTAPPPLGESCPLAEFTPHSSYEPKLLDDFHYSETTEIIFQDESSDKDAVPSYLCDAELDDETIGKALSSPLFIQERQEPADRRQAYHSHEESLLPAQSFTVRVTQEREDPCTKLERTKILLVKLI